MGLCKDLGKSQGELVEMLRPLYPRISRAAVSVAERPEESGVRFTGPARKAAYRLSGTVETAPRRTHDARTTIWFTQAQMRFLRKHMNIGVYIRGLVDEAMKKEKAAVSAGTAGDCE